MYGKDRSPEYRKYVQSTNYVEKKRYFCEKIVPKACDILNVGSVRAFNGRLTKFSNFHVVTYVNSNSITRYNRILYVSGYNDYNFLLQDLGQEPKRDRPPPHNTDRNTVESFSQRHHFNGVSSQNHVGGSSQSFSGARGSSQQLDPNVTGLKHQRRRENRVEGEEKEVNEFEKSPKRPRFNPSSATIELRPQRFKDANYMNRFPETLTKGGNYYLRVTVEHFTEMNLAQNPVFSILYQKEGGESEWAKEVKFNANLKDTKFLDGKPGSSSQSVRFLYVIRLLDTNGKRNYQILISLKTGDELYRSSWFKVTSRKSKSEKEFWGKTDAPKIAAPNVESNDKK